MQLEIPDSDQLMEDIIAGIQLQLTEIIKDQPSYNPTWSEDKQGNARYCRDSARIRALMTIALELQKVREID